LFPSSKAKAFVDRCEQYAGKGDAEEMKLREQQWEDMKKIIAWTREHAK
jgi:hypothetical protein